MSLDRDDHRRLGQELELFHLQEESPGMVFWHPRGFALYRALEDAMRRLMSRDGFLEVRTPQVMRQPIWEASGHWEHFRDGMLLIAAGDDPPAALKPVSCPGHLQIARRMMPSYRDLPLRIGELGLVHRSEPSGTLHGLFRLRQFTQDDGHILCIGSDQIRSEISKFFASLKEFYASFGFGDFSVGFSGRPPLRAGSDRVWDRAEAELLEAARAVGLDPIAQPGQGAFYGPKLELALRDRLGRSWQCGTIQLDFVLPERFGVEYVGAGGERRHPAMLHRAMLGSLERFLGVVLEHCAGKLPAWLAPEQIVIAPVSSAQAEYASACAAQFRARGLRVRIDAREESLGKRVAEAHALGVPYFVVAGDRERERGRVMIRGRDASPRELSLEEAAAELERGCAPPI